MCEETVSELAYMYAKTPEVSKVERAMLKTAEVHERNQSYHVRRKMEMRTSQPRRYTWGGTGKQKGHSAGAANTSTLRTLTSALSTHFLSL